jgi:orotidine-5'-phosphate decarboxylase
MINERAREFFENDITSQGGFKDVPVVMLTSGELGIYYINSEVVARDGNEFKNYQDDPLAMYKHTLRLMDKHPNYRKGIEFIVNSVRERLPHDRAAICGGQTRDWLFSMPAANLLGVPHLAIFKPENGGHMTGQINGGRPLDIRAEDAYNAVQISDLLTKGSSYHEVIRDQPQGWIHSLRKAGVTMKDAFFVVSRLQGGEQMLARQGVTAHTFLDIDEAFLRKHSKNPEEAVAYLKDPLGKAKEYFAKHGVLEFARHFNPSGGKLDRVAGFLEIFGDHLRETGQMSELEELVSKQFHMSPQALASGEARYSAGNTFADKWRAAVERKGSILCAGLDPADYWQAAENTLPEGVNKLEWCLDFIDKVAPYAAAVKPNRNFIKDLSKSEVREIVNRIHSHGMVAIDDSKLADIGNTNDSGFYHAEQEGYDAVTYAPFPGNIGEAAKQAHARGLGLIALVLMSNPEYKVMKEATVNGMKMYEHIATEVAKHDVDAMVIGAPSVTNHITDAEVRRVRELAGGRLVLMPGIGAQGGDAQYIMEVFGDNVIANVGRAVLYAKDPAHEASKYRNMLHALRKK